MKAFQVTFYGRNESATYNFEETVITVAKDMAAAWKKAMKHLGKSESLLGVKAYVEIGEAI